MSRELLVEHITPTDAININHRKEGRLERAYIAIDKAGRKICDIRIYRPGRQVSACIWYSYAGIYGNGSARTDGYGYDKESAAVAVAFIKAGIKMNRSFDGTGETFAAVEALGRFLAKDDFLTVVEAYG
jgi:hypothetical protein